MTTRLTLIRHGEAAAGWGDDPDPGLSPLGARQAGSMAEDLAAGPVLPVIVSPLRRTRETCEPLADRWAVHPTVDAAVGEIPSPDQDLAGRSAWLRRVLAGRWEDLDETRRRWRDEVLAHLCGLDASAVVVTHFVVINVAIGAALGRDEVVCARPDHCSRTVVEVGAGGLRLVSGPDEAATDVR